MPFETYYAEGLATKYAVRSWIVSAIILAVGVPVTWFTFVGNPQWWVLVVVGLVFAFVLVITIAAALGAKSKWESDGRLAVRLDDEGVTLPRIGLLRWEELDSVDVLDLGFVTGNIWQRAWEALTGSSNHRNIRFSVRQSESDELVGGVAMRAGVPAVDGRFTFTGVWGDGLRSPGWDETVAAVQQAADRYGVTLHGRKN